MNLKCSLLFAFLFGFNIAHGKVTSLTKANFSSLTAKKTVFIKFFAPWCGHCKKMANDWEKLAKEWEGDEVGLIAEVDCVGTGKVLCDELGITGFPTLKYGNPADMEDYNGGRNFEAMSTFAEENLTPICSPFNMELCDGDKKKQLEGYMKMDTAAIDKQIQEEEGKLKNAQTEFQNAVAELQKKYQAISEEKDAKLAAVRDAGLGFLKAVRAAKAIEGKQPNYKDEL